MNLILPVPIANEWCFFLSSIGGSLTKLAYYSTVQHKVAKVRSFDHSVKVSLLFITHLGLLAFFVFTHVCSVDETTAECTVTFHTPLFCRGGKAFCFVVAVVNS